MIEMKSLSLVVDDRYYCNSKSLQFSISLICGC